MRCSKLLLLAALAVASAPSLRAAEIFPEAIGTRWEYQRSDSAAGAKPKTVVVTIAGKEQIKGKDTLKLETRVDDILQRTEFIIVNDRGVFSLRRAVPDGKTTNFDPPQELIPAALKFGTQWSLDDEIAGSEMHQQFTVKVEDDITVPAGKFHTFMCESEQPWPISITIQRWISPGVGVVKDVTTTRGPTGRLLSRVTLALQKFTPAVPPNEAPTPLPNERSPAPSASPSPAAPPHFILLIAAERDGEMVTDLPSNVENVFVRWTGENLPVGAHVKVTWVAEDVGDVAPPNFIVDQSEAIVEAPKFGAQFTLARPKDGWAAGKYRVDLFLDDKLMDTAHVKISE